MRKLTLAMAVLGLSLSGSSFATTEIQWWHAMGGANGQELNKIVKEFNDSQDKYKVDPVFKGNYTETMTSAIAAFRAHKQPAIVQVFEVGTASMMAAKGAIYPVYKLMKDTHEPFNPKDYLSSVTGYYSDLQGNMLSMPFNSSTPVLYYNKDMFKKAGISSPPKTWEEVAADSKKLLASGAKCGFTTGWQSWVQLENLSARHNVPFASNDDGFSGIKGTKLLFNGPLQVMHITKMHEWQKSGIFSYGGRRSDSVPMFYSQQCAMYTGSSSAYGGMVKNAKFDFGVSSLPYWASEVKKPNNTIIGGASLWVLRGKSKEQYKAAAAFLHFLSTPKIQAEWHQFTGYLPITHAAYELTKKEGFYKTHPGTDVAVLQMTASKPTVNSRGLRLGNFVQIRDVINSALESVWSGQATPQAALNTAVERGDALLRKFARAHQ